MQYLEIARRRWLIVVSAFVVTTVMTLAFVLPKPAIYESSGTYIIRPNPFLDVEDSTRAFDALARNSQIGATYASIARSELIRARALERLGSERRWSGLHSSAEVETGTNVLRIGVRARDPEAAHDLTVAIGAATVAHVANLKGTYSIEPLDAPDLPTKPINSRKILTIAVGVILGAMLGVGLAVLVEYVAAQRNVARSRRAESRLDRSMTIDAEPDLVSETTFNLRLREQTARADQNGRSFRLGVLRVERATGSDGNGSGDEHSVASRTVARGDLTRVAHLLRAWGLRRGERLGLLDDGAFVLLLPDESTAGARRLLRDWQAAIASTLDGDSGETSSLRVSSGVCEYRRGQFVGDRDAERLARTMMGVEADGDHPVRLDQRVT